MKKLRQKFSQFPAVSFQIIQYSERIRIEQLGASRFPDIQSVFFQAKQQKANRGTGKAKVLSAGQNPLMVNRKESIEYFKNKRIGER